LLIRLTAFFKVVDNQLNAFDEYCFIKDSSLREETGEEVPTAHPALQTQVLALRVFLARLFHESSGKGSLNEFRYEACAEKDLAAAALVKDRAFQVYDIEMTFRLDDYVKRDILNEVGLAHI
jgi:hypothetical protein